MPGVWDKFDGGEITSDAKLYNAGGMADAEVLTGKPQTDEVKISRGFRTERDAPLKKWLNAKLNQPVIVGKQALNPDKTPVPGGLETFRGILSGIGTPQHDSEGESVTELELTITVAGLPA